MTIAIGIFVLGFMACKSKKTGKENEKFHSNAKIAIDYLNDLDKYNKRKRK